MGGIHEIGKIKHASAPAGVFREALGGLDIYQENEETLTVPCGTTSSLRSSVCENNSYAEEAVQSSIASKLEVVETGDALAGESAGQSRSPRAVQQQQGRQQQQQQQQQESQSQAKLQVVGQVRQSEASGKNIAVGQSLIKSSSTGGCDWAGAAGGKRQRWQQGMPAGATHALTRRATTSAASSASASTSETSATMTSTKTVMAQSRVIDFFCVVELHAENFWVRQRFPAVAPYTFPEALLLMCLRDIFGTLTEPLTTAKYYSQFKGSAETSSPPLSSTTQKSAGSTMSAGATSCANSKERPSYVGGNTVSTCSFVLPDATGVLLYCSVTQVLDANQYICAVSRHPVMTFMETALLELASLCDRDLCNHVIIEPFVRSLIAEVPVPPSDRCMRMTWERSPIFKRRLCICTPRMRHLPMVDDRCFLTLFQSFRPKLVLEILEHLLAEDSVILHSTDASRLVPIAEAFRAILFPFVWQSLYVPLLPRSEWHMLQASSPFLVGVCCTDTGEFKLRLHANCAYQRQTAKRFVLANIDAGQYEVVSRTPGLLRRLTSSSSNNFHQQHLNHDDTEDEETDVSALKPVPTIPEPLRTNLLAQLSTIIPDTLTSPCTSPRAGSPNLSASSSVPSQTRQNHQVPHHNGFGKQNSTTTQSTYSGSTAFSFPYSVNSAQSGSKNSATSNSSTESNILDESADERVWIDHVRIAMLELYLTLFSHLKFHLVPLSSSSSTSPYADASDTASLGSTTSHSIRGRGTSPNVMGPATSCSHLSSSASTCSLSSLGSASSTARTMTTKRGFDPVTFVADLPVAYQSFVDSFVSRRLFCDLITRQVSAYNPTLFDRLVSIWRKQSVHPVKRKMSPLARMLNDMLTGLGYSMSATRLAIDRLVIFSPEEMNELFTSVTKVREALDHMGIPRFIVEEDSVPASPDNPRTAKLRSLLQRPQLCEKPPLVCKISLDKFHRGVPGTWADNPNHAGRLAPLRRDLVLASTVATLPHQPMRHNRAETRCAKLTSLALINIRHRSGIEEASSAGTEFSEDGSCRTPGLNQSGADYQVPPSKSFGDIVRVVSGSTLSSVNDTFVLQNGIHYTESATSLSSRDADEANHVDSSARIRALRWQESQAQVASEDATDTLLSHIAATESVRRHETEQSRTRIDALERELTESKQLVKELQNRLAAVRTSDDNSSTASSPRDAWQPDSPLLPSRVSTSDGTASPEDSTTAAFASLPRTRMRRNSPLFANTAIRRRSGTLQGKDSTNALMGVDLGLSPEQIPPRPKSAQPPTSLG